MKSRKCLILLSIAFPAFTLPTSGRVSSWTQTHNLGMTRWVLIEQKGILEQNWNLGNALFYSQLLPTSSPAVYYPSQRQRLHMESNPKPGDDKGIILLSCLLLTSVIYRQKFLWDWVQDENIIPLFDVFEMFINNFGGRIILVMSHLVELGVGRIGSWSNWNFVESSIGAMLRSISWLGINSQGPMLKKILFFVFYEFL